MALFSPPRKPSSPLASMRGDHAGVRVPDFDAAVAWYTEKLDFRLTATTEAVGLKWGFLAPPDDDDFQIEIAAGPGAVDRPGAGEIEASLGQRGWHHLCLKVDSIEDTLAELGRRGVTIVAGPLEYEPIRRRGGFFADPWGNLIEIIQDA
ncbi:MULTISPECIES: VOC family protein [Alphaproteobacteria]|uniref:VOC family protein n=1 Tax=Methylobacterium currus TaxID=2051553 RepID=A0A2R4WW78_9HYPH|nr:MULTISPECIES: VOC family protein [Alphaproteobacteria]AWB25770.1 VOC family protein [Methylobacterium currus]MBX3478211.1 VOC family protein [Brevundimonas sp.]NGM32806.1 VOC family protein [Methylobacterium sp. DB0501]